MEGWAWAGGNYISLSRVTHIECLANGEAVIHFVTGERTQPMNRDQIAALMKVVQRRVDDTSEESN